MPRVRRSKFLYGTWVEDEFLVTHCLTGKVTRIHPAVLPLLARAAAFAPSDELRASRDGSDWPKPLVQALTERDVLIEEDGPVHLREQVVTEHWPEGMDAQIFHFGTQPISFLSLEQERQALALLASKRPPPAIHKANDATLRPLPDTLRQADRFLDLLRSRRTVRSFADRPLDLDDFSRLTQWTWGAMALLIDPILGPYQVKTSPSGGARHPTEVYVLVRNVTGLEQGIYHYDPIANGLRLVSTSCDGDLAVAMCAGQTWVHEAAAVFFMTSVIGRSAWKYRHAHVYRVLLLDAGHLGQTFHLVATHLGLAPFTTAAMDHKLVEQVLQVDGVTEFPIYAAAVGHPRD